LKRNLEDFGNTFDLNVRNASSDFAIHVTAQFSLLIRNIGLASLVDYEITKIQLYSYEIQSNNSEKKFSPVFILRKDEKEGVNINVDLKFNVPEGTEKEKVFSLLIGCQFDDL